jgi:pyruvate formate lyase activating enzyme
MIGREMSISEILDVVAVDDGFHYRSGGGVTVGGGDPIMQADFVGALLSACRDRGIDTAIETAGFGQWDQLEKICRYANLILYDVKSMDAEKHKLITGVSNKTILENLGKLANRFPEIPIVVRTPIIPGFNATHEDISVIVNFLKTIRTLKNYQLLPYHRFATPKYGQLDKPCSYADTRPPDKKCMQRLRAVVKEHLVLHPVVTKTPVLHTQHGKR